MIGGYPVKWILVAVILGILVIYINDINSQLSYLEKENHTQETIITDLQNSRSHLIELIGRGTCKIVKSGKNPFDNFATLELVDSNVGYLFCHLTT